MFGCVRSFLCSLPPQLCSISRWTLHLEVLTLKKSYSLKTSVKQMPHHTIKQSILIVLDKNYPNIAILHTYRRVSEDESHVDIERNRMQISSPQPDRSPSSVALAPSQQISATSPCPSDVLPQNYRLKYRSQTFAFGFHRTERSKTFLGIKVEKDLERRQKDRKGRRVQFGEVTPQSTTQFGKQCSPFHALTTPTWREVELPDDIPLSQRMLNRGYTGKNLTINDIKSMDFSYGLPETPPQTRGQTPGNARGLSTPGQPLSSRQDKGARLLLPPIKSGRSKSSSSSVRGSVGGLRKSSTVL